MPTDKKHLAELLFDYAIFSGLSPEIAKKGIWENKIDDHWTVRLNGQKEMIDGLPGLSWAIEFNGWPAGIMTVLGDGVLCAGAEGNEDNLRLAIENKMSNG